MIKKGGKLEVSLNELKQLTTSISNTHNLNTLEKDKIDEQKNKITPNITPQKECKNPLELIKTINNNKSRASGNVNNIEEDYEKKELEELIENEKRSNTIKYEIKEKMEYITENLDRIKEAISSKETEEKLKKIEKLISEESLYMAQFSSERAQISDDIKSIIKNFYEHDLREQFVNTSQFLKKHEKCMSTTYTKEEIDNILSETKRELDKIASLQCEHFRNIKKIRRRIK
ncbi:hypothetical protein POWCR01_000089900 [Plasmodium ovale]|uniref:Uncharacterized protein n=1 Tax=Plasmodium ovale TaxID=36330 RepID=A0A1C3KHK9_PLAOA|nr:hypothetical protein POWCR01_000089900 [Plasmodium ovale]